ncbi:MAG: hypothetical protein HY344_00575 [Candidatus Levybacteria bacterium]|nr:hypothetical protein [Candidatus Levybacteria bacterium]
MAKDPISKFFKENTHYSKTKDDLIDIHVGNPLYRIVELLEDIKKQKAFSFTLKGSLGIMGVFLALSVFGIFGGGKILCDKGSQSQIGEIRVLNIEDNIPSQIPLLDPFLDYFAPRQTYKRTVLIKNDGDVVRLPYVRNLDFSKYLDQYVIATGNFDSCGQTLTLEDKEGMEMLEVNAEF